MNPVVYNYYTIEADQIQRIYTIEFCVNNTENSEAILIKTFEAAVKAFAFLQKEYEEAKKEMGKYIDEKEIEIDSLNLSHGEHLKTLEDLNSFETILEQQLEESYNIKEIKGLSHFFLEALHLSAGGKSRESLEDLIYFEKSLKQQLDKAVKVLESLAENRKAKLYTDETDSWKDSTHLGDQEFNETILLKIFKRNVNACLYTLKIDRPDFTIRSPALAKCLQPSFEKYRSSKSLALSLS